MTPSAPSPVTRRPARTWNFPSAICLAGIGWMYLFALGRVGASPASPDTRATTVGRPVRVVSLCLVWTSAYSAGGQLGAYALLHHFYIVTATQSGARVLAREYGLEELRDYVHRSRNAINVRRGAKFSVSASEAGVEHAP